jgi:hypothetical protein
MSLPLDKLLDDRFRKSVAVHKKDNISSKF